MMFRSRSTELEIMDDPALDPHLLHEVFVDIQRVNRFLNGYAITLKAVEKMLAAHPQRSYTIMDLGCGNGDMLKQLARYAKARGIVLQLIGVDMNGNTIRIARENCKEFTNISFIEADILTMGSHFPACDILLCILTLHHVKERHMLPLLERMVRLPRIGIIINDLQRSRLAYFLFQAFSLIFIRTEMARNDGLVSIRSAFRKAELREYARALPEVAHQLNWKWAFRYLWVMQITNK